MQMTAIVVVMVVVSGHSRSCSTRPTITVQLALVVMQMATHWQPVTTTDTTASMFALLSRLIGFVSVCVCGLSMPSDYHYHGGVRLMAVVTVTLRTCEPALCTPHRDP